jgi:hypothetical protein
MSAMRDVVVLLATDEAFAAQFRANPLPVAARYGLSEAEVRQILAMTATDASAGPTALDARLSKSSIGTGGLSSLFHTLSHDLSSATPTIHDPGTASGGDHTAAAGTGDHSMSGSDASPPAHDPAPVDHTVVSPDGHTTTTYHTDGTYVVENNSTHDTQTFNSHGTMVAYTNHGTTAFPPYAYAQWTHDVSSGRDVVAGASWDDASGHHTATPDPHGGNDWTVTTSSPDGSHSVMIVSLNDRDQMQYSDLVVTGPDGHSTHVVFDADGRVSSVDGNGPSSWSDASGQHSVVHNADGTVTVTDTATDGSRTVTTTDGHGHAASQTSYDSSGHQTVTRTFNPDGSVAHAEGTFESNGGASTTTYHADGSYTVAVHATGDSTTFNSHGQIVSYTDHATMAFPPYAYAQWTHDYSSGHDVTSASWDDTSGHHTATPDPHGGGWIETTTAPDGTTTVVALQDDGNMHYHTSEQSVTAPDGTVTVTHYDVNGNVTSTTTTPPGGSSAGAGGTPPDSGQQPASSTPVASGHVPTHLTASATSLLGRPTVPTPPPVAPHLVPIPVPMGDHGAAAAPVAHPTVPVQAPAVAHPTVPVQAPAVAHAIVTVQVPAAAPTAAAQIHVEAPHGSVPVVGPDHTASPHPTVSVAVAPGIIGPEHPTSVAEALEVKPE